LLSDYDNGTLPIRIIPVGPGDAQRRPDWARAQACARLQIHATCSGSRFRPTVLAFDADFGSK